MPATNRHAASVRRTAPGCAKACIREARLIVSPSAVTARVVTTVDAADYSGPCIDAHPQQRAKAILSLDFGGLGC